MRVKNASCIHELMCWKHFVKFKYQTFCSINALVFHILAYNCLIFLGDHGHNSSALINFVQHVKLFLEAKGNIIHLCGGLNVPNYWQRIILKLHQIHKMLELVMWKMAFMVHIEVVEINLNQLYNYYKITNETTFVLSKLAQALHCLQHMQHTS
jgi:hypothetical protein